MKPQLKPSQAGSQPGQRAAVPAHVLVVPLTCLPGAAAAPGPRPQVKECGGLPALSEVAGVPGTGATCGATLVDRHFEEHVRHMVGTFCVCVWGGGSTVWVEVGGGRIPR